MHILLHDRISVILAVLHISAFLNLPPQFLCLISMSRVWPFSTWSLESGWLQISGTAGYSAWFPLHMPLQPFDKLCSHTGEERSKWADVFATDKI